MAISLGKLDSVRQQVQQDLLKPLLISFNVETGCPQKVQVIDLTSNILHGNLVLKYFNDLVDSIPHIEDREGPGEL